ncbi:ABC transporter ATP-binding protein [Pedobacter duraquae]|uniref:ABC-type multidrug transport system ATPase subunit n=1 Tax=Pedobacter duraquae TaxID=425511 RepID=A0A4R6IEK2_9SPHI|nr:ABC transporter ATP-binding protein [Pedobacter duraquae]TDO20057.1 ABC-type multidrug transport system ATPase subunit [Pedobacter duraquae]
MNTLTINKVSKSYQKGVMVLNNISLDLKNGMFGLLGPNGAGKSSLMRTLAGLQRPDEGTILFNGNDIVLDPQIIKRQLGFLPQDFGVYPKVSAYDLLTHIAVLKGLTNSKSRKEQVMALLEQTNLYQVRNKEVHTFSGGMRQRFGVAQALLGNPQLVIVDEPTAGLDPEERNRFNNLLSEIGEDKIVILSTHLVEDVKNLCTDMAIMCQGGVIAQGKPEDFICQLRGKLWTRIINKADAEQYAERFQLISSQLISGKRLIHVVSDTNPGEGFELTEPTLEDVYFNILQTQNS